MRLLAFHYLPFSPWSFSTMNPPGEFLPTGPMENAISLGQPSASAAVPRAPTAAPESAAAAVAKSARRAGPMLRGQIPVEWLYAADTCGRQGMRVAVALWWLVGEQGIDVVLLTEEMQGRFGIKSRAVSSTLRKMQQQGLCEITCQIGMNFEVRVLRR
jgi:hypothetical protein